MRGKEMKKIFLVLWMFLFLQTTALAIDFSDFFSKLPIQRPDDVTQTLDTSLYAASVRATLRDVDGNNKNFSKVDIMERLSLSSIGGTLEFPRNSTRDQVEQFAREHAYEIMHILFPGGIASGTIGQTENQLNTSLTFQEVVAPIKEPRVTQKEIALRNELSGRLEYSNFKLNSYSGNNSIGMLLGYKSSFFSDKLEAGLLLPYKFAVLNDNVDTTSHFLQLDLFGKYNVYKDNGLTMTIGGDAFTSLLVAQSDVFDVFGNLAYGGGIFASVEKDFKVITLTAGIGFKLSKVTVPGALLPDDIGYLVKTINDRAMDRDLVYGLNIAVPFKDDNSNINLNVHRINSFSPDIPDELDSQTIIRIAVQYAISKSFIFNAGYSTVFEVKDYKPQTFFLSAIWKF
jgi:hypothetical protein